MTDSEPHIDGPDPIDRAVELRETITDLLRGFVTRGLPARYAASAASLAADQVLEEAGEGKDSIAERHYRIADGFASRHGTEQYLQGPEFRDWLKQRGRS